MLIVGCGMKTFFECAISIHITHHIEFLMSAIAYKRQIHLTTLKWTKCFKSGCFYANWVPMQKDVLLMLIVPTIL